MYASMKKKKNSLLNPLSFFCFYTLNLTKRLGIYFGNNFCLRLKVGLSAPINFIYNNSFTAAVFKAIFFFQI